MAYIGKKVEETELDNRTVDTMTGDGSDTTMSLSATPISVNNVLVFLNGVMQRPTTDFTLSGSTITFAAAPFTGAVVVAITGEGGHIGRPSSPLPTEKFMNSAVTNAKLMSGLASSKLTGAMPALDGAALTGGPDGYTESTSDPVITTNPSTGVGTLWINKSSGEAFCLTDATANENVWTNIGGGIGDVKPYEFGGDISGYNCGGEPPSYRNTIEKFSFTSLGNSTDVSDMTVARRSPQGSSSPTHGYNAAGGFPDMNVIDKCPFASDANATDVGDTTVSQVQGGGHSSETHGYSAGGQDGPAASNVIDKYPFASDTNATDIGNLSSGKYGQGAQSSITHGYQSGGYNGSSRTTFIDKFSFSSGTQNASAYSGVITQSRSYMNGASSATHGYTMGGFTPTHVNTIDKFSFASEGNATDVGDMTTTSRGASAQSSTTYGYNSGGYNGSAYVNVIDYFSFSTDGNATDVGDLITASSYGAGLQH